MEDVAKARRAEPACCRAKRAAFCPYFASVQVIVDYKQQLTEACKVLVSILCTRDAPIRFDNSCQWLKKLCSLVDVASFHSYEGTWYHSHDWPLS